MSYRDDTARAIEQWITAHRDEYVSDIKAFCAIKSVSRADQGTPGAPFGEGCRQALDWTLKRSAELGFKTVDHEGYCGTARWGDQDNAIGLLGHIDVVPEGDGWIYPPYDVTEIGDFLIGRGVGDDKGPSLAALYAMRCLKDLGIIMKHGVRVFFGCSEETGMQDLRYYIDHDTMPKVSLVPDCGFPVCIAQKGQLKGTAQIPAGSTLLAFDAGLVENMVPALATAKIAADAGAMERALAHDGALPEGITVCAADGGCTVRAVGVAAHAARPEKGKSALHMLAGALKDCDLIDGTTRKAMSAIDTLTGGYFGETCGLAAEDDVSGKTTTNFGLAHLCDGKITVSIDSRLSIAQDPAEALKKYESVIRALGFGDFAGETSNPFHIDSGDPIVTALMEVYKDVTGRDDQPYAMGGGTYSRYLDTAISYGPGIPVFSERPDIPESHGGAHRCDEFLYIPSLITALKIYALSLLRLDEALS